MLCYYVYLLYFYYYIYTKLFVVVLSYLTVVNFCEQDDM